MDQMALLIANMEIVYMEGKSIKIGWCFDKDEGVAIYKSPLPLSKLITSTDLLTNMELNVETSMKLLNRLKRMYGTWELALGAYHTGRPIVDNYAKSIVKFKI